MNSSAAEDEARRRGRRAIMIGYYVLAAIFVAIAAGNVTYQVWAPALREYPPEPCGRGLSELAASVDAARAAAHASDDGDEEAALQRFRQALWPVWSRYDAIAASCRQDPPLATALDVIQRLRYAEERAVRRESTELVPLR